MDSLLAGLSPRELGVLLDFCELLVFTVPVLSESRQRYIDLTGDDGLSTAAKVWAGVLNGQARTACDSSEDVLRNHARRALDVARRRLSSALGRVRGDSRPVDAIPFATYPGPPTDDASLAWLCHLDDEEFVFRAHEVVLERFCRPSEFGRWRDFLGGDTRQREALLTQLRADALRVGRREALRRAGTGAAFHVMGTGDLVTEQDWRERARSIAEDPAMAAPVPAARRAPYRPGGHGRPLVSVLTSLYRGGAHIDRFLANILSQTCAADIELIIIDAASPDAEAEVIGRWARRFPQIRYTRCNERIGIYAAWNLAISQARGEFLTNANVDDLRRSDSLECQLEALRQRPDVDVVYQDFYYTMDPELSYAEVAAHGYLSRLPSAIDAEVLMSCNPPHHAPMWRRRLHDELGPFDTSLRSAGDYDFWVRCLAAGKRFVKADEPTAVYYQNPAGVSTRPDTRGHAESRLVLRRHGRRLLRSTAWSGAPGPGVA